MKKYKEDNIKMKESLVTIHMKDNKELFITVLLVFFGY